MNIFDIIIIIVLVFGFVRGIMKGLFVEVASLVALIAGVYGAIHFSHFIADILTPRLDWHKNYITLLSFAITFAIIVIVISLLGKTFTKLANFMYLGWVNKILGGIFGSLKLALILSILLLIFDKFNNHIPFIKQEEKERSILYQPIKNLAPTLFPYLIKITSEKKENNTKHVEVVRLEKTSQIPNHREDTYILY